MVSDTITAETVTDKPCLTEIEMERLIDEYGDHLLRLCTLYLKDTSLAEDALQDTFIRVWKKWGSFQGKSSEKTWLTSIAINVCKNHLRSPWNSKTDLKDLTEFARHGKNEFEQIDEQIDVMNAVLELKEKYRIVILLYYYEELSVKEIASVLSKKESTILTRLKRAREQLHGLIRPQKGGN